MRLRYSHYHISITGENKVFSGIPGVHFPDPIFNLAVCQWGQAWNIPLPETFKQKTCELEDCFSSG